MNRLRHGGRKIHHGDTETRRKTESRMKIDSVYDLRFHEILIVIFSVALSLCGLSFPASAANSAGSTGAAFLELGVGARAAAMGEANAAWADDVYGLYFNPAGVSRVERKEIGFVHNNLFSDVSYNYLGYLHPLSFGGTFGITVAYVDLGEVKRTTIASAATNSFIGQATSHDLAVSLAYARPVRSWLDLGGTLKVINESLDNNSASAVAVDMGATIRPPVRGLTLGVSLANLGSSLQFIREKDELPLTLRLGAAYRSPNRIWGIVSDAVWVRDQDWEAKVGGEAWVWPEHLALRAGVNSANDLDNGFTVGSAFHWEDLAIDYAFTPFGEIGDAHQISLTYQFGDPRTTPGGSTRIPAPEPAGSQRASARTAPTYGQTEPALPPAAVSQLAPAVCALPFVYQSGAAEHEWIGGTMPEIFHHNWRQKGILARTPGVARFTLEGNYWVVNDLLIVNAVLKDEGWEAQKFQWRGEVAKGFLVFDAMVARVNEELAKRGVR
jgi:hypothetical protein